MIHRRDKFRASRVLQQRVLSNSKITVRWNAQVKEFTAAEAALSANPPCVTSKRTNDPISGATRGSG